MRAYERPPHNPAHWEKARKRCLCPFGCVPDTSDCDDRNYCRHLVGFTNDGVTFEPLKPLMLPDRRGELRQSTYRLNDGAHPEPVLPTDQVVQVGTSVTFRVYRDVDKKALPAAETAKPKKKRAARKRPEKEPAGEPALA